MNSLYNCRYSEASLVSCPVLCVPLVFFLILSSCVPYGSLVVGSGKKETIMSKKKVIATRNLKEYTGFRGELEHLTIETRLIGEIFECVMGECVI